MKETIEMLEKLYDKEVETQDAALADLAGLDKESAAQAPTIRAEAKRAVEQQKRLMIAIQNLKAFQVAGA